ncbi:hypothetical protein DFP73DRAFT_200382 [Morchella snyderi]|nr:hypothetical protein DFP73DRAFT_200382 [Morchella snyderi]
MSRKPTTGFFDTDHSAKRAPSWKRNPNALQQRDPSSHASRTNSAAGSIPVSTETKSKLGAFAFNKPSTPIKAATKPGNAPGCRGGGGDDNDDNDLEVSKSNSKTTTPGPDAIKECPKTPAPRLQLSDLIGIGDEGTPTQALLQARDSPEDRIMWQMSPRGTPNGASQTTPAPKKGRRGKKRTASPNVVTPIGRKRGETFNLQRLGVLNTPLADPAMQLWSKYSTAGNSSGSNPDANPAARLFGAEGTNQSPLGLRRAYSCGPDWPQTRLKRRKVVSPEDISELDEAPEGPTGSEGVSGNRAPGPSRLSRVSRLVDKVKETLEKPSSMPNILSSSPLHESYLDGTSSPIRRGGGGRTYTINSQAEESDDDNNNNDDNDNNDDDDDSNDKGEGHIASSGSEDFGDFDDDDIDMMMLDKAEVLAESNTGAHQTTASLAGGPVVEPELPSGKGQQFLEPETLKKSVVEEEDEDEFGDDDDDEFSAGVENLISKYETTQTTVNNPNTSSPDQQRQFFQSRPEYKKTATEIAASQVLEEFGDIDFDDWNDEELELSNGLVRQVSLIVARWASNDLKKDLKPKSIRRYLVLEISLGSWIWKNQSHREEKVSRTFQIVFIQESKSFRY